MVERGPLDRLPSADEPSALELSSDVFQNLKLLDAPILFVQRPLAQLPQRLPLMAARFVYVDQSVGGLSRNDLQNERQNLLDDLYSRSFFRFRHQPLCPCPRRLRRRVTMLETELRLLPDKRVSPPCGKAQEGEGRSRPAKLFSFYHTAPGRPFPPGIPMMNQAGESSIRRRLSSQNPRQSGFDVSGAFPPEISSGVPSRPIGRLVAGNGLSSYDGPGDVMH